MRMQSRYSRPLSDPDAVIVLSDNCSTSDVLLIRLLASIVISHLVTPSIGAAGVCRVRITLKSHHDAH